uniref:Uncharacterized protein n=1 Tax=Anguilla anguilla TaxID=7936 RepID=A0A0E9UCC3_ANGAN
MSNPLPHTHPDPQCVRLIHLQRTVCVHALPNTANALCSDTRGSCRGALRSQ